MRINNKPRNAATVLCLLALLFAQGTAFGYSSQPDIRQSMELARLRVAGPHGDLSQVPDLIATLQQNPPKRSLMDTVLHSVAQMGAEEALPAIDDFIAAQKDVKAGDFPDERVLNFTKVARARLVAEASVTNLQTESQKTNAKVVRLCQELGLSAVDINKVAAVNKVQQTPWHHPPVPVEVYAMREIADIVYHSPVHDLKGIPIASSLEVKSDYPTQLKMQLVGLSEAKRIDWLINDLAHKKVMADNEDFEIQLADDYGASAGKAALALLVRMDDHRAEYKSAGFDAMIRIVYGSGYQASQVQEHFLNDPDPNVANSAYVGISGTGIVGY